MVGQEPVNRIRSKHSRSRTGCLPCKERHNRCDEQRPQCSNCIRASRECEYPPFGLVVRTSAKKTKLPGVGATWQITPQLSVATMDPFASLPVDMPFNSANLLKYFMQPKVPVCRIVAPDKWLEFLSVTKNDSITCHNVLITAGVYFASCAGGLLEFEPAYLHHKLECINTVNAWLADPVMRLTAQCMNMISTLCSAEVCLGNYAAAEHHLTGLMTILELRAGREQTDESVSVASTKEMAKRYVLISHLTMAIIRSSGLASQSYGHGLSRHLTPSGGKDTSEHQSQIDHLRLMPYFFAVPVNVEFRRIPVDQAINDLTSLMAQHEDTLGGWSFHAQVSLLRSFKRQHVRSLQPPGQEEGSPFKVATVSWGGWIAAATFFVYGVMQPEDGDVPIDTRLAVHLCSALASESDTALHAQDLNDRETAVWLWMAFAAVMGLHRMTHAMDNLSGAAITARLEAAACNRLRAFTQSRRIRNWTVAKQILQSVAWPGSCPDVEAEMIWDHAITHRFEDTHTA